MGIYFNIKTWELKNLLVHDPGPLPRKHEKDVTDDPAELRASLRGAKSIGSETEDSILFYAEGKAVFWWMPIPKKSWTDTD